MPAFTEREILLILIKRMNTNRNRFTHLQTFVSCPGQSVRALFAFVELSIIESMVTERRRTVSGTGRCAKSHDLINLGYTDVEDGSTLERNFNVLSRELIQVCRVGELRNRQRERLVVSSLSPSTRRHVVRCAEMAV